MGARMQEIVVIMASLAMVVSGSQTYPKVKVIDFAMSGCPCSAQFASDFSKHVLQVPGTYTYTPMIFFLGKSYRSMKSKLIQLKMINYR